MRILVTGATGLIGSALVPRLTAAGHEVLRLVRSEPAGNDEVRWDPEERRIDAASLEGIDAAVHLAGESLMGRWSEGKKRRILKSRVDGTLLLCETLAGLESPPKVLVASSAVGYYGEKGEQPLGESAPAGEAFLSEVCRQWEAATKPAAKKGIRVVNLRTAPVLTPQGGALGQMLLPFRLGVGGVLGSGRQYFPWVSFDDALGAIEHCLTTDSLQGPVNLASPQSVTNREFTKTLGRVLRRPTVIPLPAFALRIMFGQMADEMLLMSTRVEPAKLVESGYSFRFPELEGALRHVLG